MGFWLWISKWNEPQIPWLRHSLSLPGASGYCRLYQNLTKAMFSFSQCELRYTQSQHLASNLSSASAPNILKNVCKWAHAYKLKISLWVKDYDSFKLSGCWIVVSQIFCQDFRPLFLLYFSRLPTKWCPSDPTGGFSGCLRFGMRPYCEIWRCNFPWQDDGYCSFSRCNLVCVDRPFPCCDSVWFVALCHFGLCSVLGIQWLLCKDGFASLSISFSEVVPFFHSWQIHILWHLNVLESCGDNRAFGLTVVLWWFL